MFDRNGPIDSSDYSSSLKGVARTGRFGCLLSDVADDADLPAFHEDDLGLGELERARLIF